MDQQRFDSLARWLAGRQSRRRVVQVAGVALAGAAGLGFRQTALAQEGGSCVDIGGQCATSDECCGSSLVCFEGICDAPQGCLNEGGPCKSDDGCCGDLVCADGFCAAATCGAMGDPCTDPSQCCEFLTCFEGVCDNPRGCFPLGGPCTTNDDCCEGFTCGDTQTCIATAECAALGQGCQANEQCCDNLVCFEAVCDNPRGCSGEGDGCGADTDCCGDLVCSTDGACIQPPVTTLPGTGAGTGSSGGNLATGLTLAGAAAAAIAGARLRRSQRSVPAEPTDL